MCIHTVFTVKKGLCETSSICILTHEFPPFDVEWGGPGHRSFHSKLLFSPSSSPTFPKNYQDKEGKNNDKHNLEGILKLSSCGNWVTVTIRIRVESHPQHFSEFFCHIVHLSFQLGNFIILCSKFK